MGVAQVSNMMNRNLKILFIVSSLMGLLVGFQNCSAPVPGTPDALGVGGDQSSPSSDLLIQKSDYILQNSNSAESMSASLYSALYHFKALSSDSGGESSAGDQSSSESGRIQVQQKSLKNGNVLEVVKGDEFVSCVLDFGGSQAPDHYSATVLSFQCGLKHSTINPSSASFSSLSGFLYDLLKTSYEAQQKGNQLASILVRKDSDSYFLIGEEGELACRTVFDSQTNKIEYSCEFEPYMEGESSPRL